MKRVSLLSILVIMIFLLLSCDNDEMSEFETYSNDQYSIEYPSDWLDPIVDADAVVFSTENGEMMMGITTSRIYPYQENYVEEALMGTEKDVDIEECDIAGNRGYKIQLQVNDEMNTAYVVQEKDLFLEMNFVYQTSDHGKYQSLINQMKSTLAFYDFETLKELNRSPIVEGDREAKWSADIDFIAEKLPASHKDLFFNVKEEAFIDTAKRLKQEIPTRTDDEMIVRVSQWIASVGDAHTSFLFPSRAAYPLSFYHFEDGIYLIDSAPEHRAFIGYKLKAINEKSIEEISEIFRSIIPHENESWFKKRFAEELVTTELLRGLHITDAPTAEFIFIDENGNEKSVEVATVSSDEMKPQQKREVPAEKMLYLKNHDKYYWYTYLEEDKLLYFQYNACYDRKDQSFADFNNELFEYVDRHTVDKFVIDLRNNGGGSALVLDPFFDELKKRNHLDDRKKLFVIVGRETFSSAVQNALRFKNETNATFLGESTGGKPNHYGEIQRLKLSNTNTEVSYSTQYFESLSEDVDSFVPDIVIELTADDYFRRIDPAMERVLNLNSYTGEMLIE